MNAKLATLTSEQRRIAQLEYRLRYLPMGLKRARDRLTRLESEAIDLGMHDLVELRNSHLSGDLIATEWLRRLRA